MSAPDHDRVSEVFIETVGLDREDRPARLAALCGDDMELRREVESLLRHHDRSGEAFKPVLHPPTPSAELLAELESAARSPVPERIGRYRIVDRLGEGGMGVVYRAEQDRPMRREVALKVIKPGMDSAAIVARFSAELQALAMMEHPGVAKVLDGGSTADGRPYFVMEFVHGEPITGFCDRHRLPIASRVALLIGVCEAVQHAHLKGIIHRDLKPSNILVEMHDGRPLARVIDFGVAKALAGAVGGPLTDFTLTEGAGQLIGTPAYMSPEQAAATGSAGHGNVDTRTDIWSLGVVLYELLIGVTPMDGALLRQRGMLEVARLVTESEAPKPTTRLAAIGSEDPERVARIAAARQVDPPTLRRLLTREIGWITMKCLAHEPGRRYESASELARDLRRHLDGEPVLAAPPSRLYRVGKFARRHRGPVAAGATITLTLVAATAVSLQFGLREAEQRAVVERQRAELSEIVAFQADMLGSIDPVAMGQGIVQQMRRRIERALERADIHESARHEALAELDGLLGHLSPTDLALDAIDAHLLRSAAASLGDRFAGQPLVEAALRHTMATIYHDVGLVAEADPHIERALALRRAQLGDDHLDTLRTKRLLAASLLRFELDHDASIAAFSQVVDGLARTLGTHDRETLDTMMALAAAHRAARRLSEAEAVIRTVRLRAGDALGETDAVTIHALAELGSLLLEAGNAPEGEAILAEAFRVAELEHGPTSQLTLRIANDRSQSLLQLGRREEAESAARFALDGRRLTLGRDHPYTLTSLNNLGVIVRRAGRFDEAESLYREALDTSRRLHGASHSTTLSLQHNLALLLQSTNRLDEAEPLLDEVLRLRRAVLGPDHTDTVRTLNAYGGLLQLRARHDEAMVVFGDALRTLSARHPPTHPDVLRAHHNLAACLRSTDRLEDAELHQRIAYDGRLATLGAGHRDSINSALGLARTLHALGRLDEAAALATETHREATAHFGDAHPLTMALRGLLTELKPHAPVGSEPGPRAPREP